MVRIEEGIKMKKVYSFCVLAVFTVLLTLVSGCVDNLQTDPEEMIQGQEGTFVLTIKASKAITTKALNHPDEHNIISTWTQDEKVTVYNETKGAALSDFLKAKTGGSGTTTLTGSVTGKIEVGDKLTLSYGSNDYAGQDGTLNVANRTTSISQKCDYALATVHVNSIVQNNGKLEVTIEESVAAFAAQQAIINFNFLDEMGNAISTPESVTICYGSTGTISLSGLTTENTYGPNNSQNGSLFIAIPGFSDGKLSIEITKDGKKYFYENDHAAIVNGKYYRAIVYMYNDTTSPLTFEAITAGTTISFTKHSSGGDFSCPIEYQLNHGDLWTAYTGPVTLANVGDKVRFRGLNKAYARAEGGGDPYYSFEPSDSCYVYGNIMSLVNNTHPATAVELEKAYTFYKLFAGTRIKSHKSKNIVLPATTLQNNCYWGMFMECNGIYKAPELPATQLKEKCYFKMFLETGLHEVPSLQATNLASQCYESMFQDCKNLTKIPDKLPATTLASECYRYMFSGCTGLTAIPEGLLPAATLTSECYGYMFSRCTGLTAIPSKLFEKVTALDTYCYHYMFKDCTGLTSIPANLLPVTTLATGCYEYMFSGCKGLTGQQNSIPADLLPASTLAQNCYSYMFEQCTELTKLPDGFLGAVTSLAKGCYAYMFLNCNKLETVPTNMLGVATLVDQCYTDMFAWCSSLTNAPKLPATTLVPYCYKEMFYKCTNLAAVTCLATSITANECTKDWLSEVASPGAFTKSANIIVGEGGWSSDGSGIPFGWTVSNY